MGEKHKNIYFFRDVSLFSGGGKGHYFGGEGHNFFPLVWGKVTRRTILHLEGGSNR